MSSYVTKKYISVKSDIACLLNFLQFLHITQTLLYWNMWLQKLNTFVSKDTFCRMHFLWSEKSHFIQIKKKLNFYYSYFYIRTFWNACEVWLNPFKDSKWCLHNLHSLKMDNKKKGGGAIFNIYLFSKHFLCKFY